METDTKTSYSKTGKPELAKIPVKNLRNYSGAMLYYETQDPILIMRHLRHKKMDTTMHYLKHIVLDPASQAFVSKGPTTDKEAQELLDNGWTYVLTTPNGTMLFRKHK